MESDLKYILTLQSVLGTKEITYVSISEEQI